MDLNPSSAEHNMPCLSKLVNPDQLASDLDLHCLSLNMRISLKNPDRVI